MKIKTLSCIIALSLPIFSVNASVIPYNGKFVNGDGTISRPTKNEMLVEQNTAKGIIDWTSFNIGKGYSVKFKQPDSNSVTLNRVTGSALTNIVGNLTSNGKVFLVNPNGIMLRSGANMGSAWNSENKPR
ncbi:filamentous hemagglutinin N-terminal domain-containing protein [Escherichia coli]|uniref:two-partner secretion domain-containing protein n=1 Tax=Escherichia coli TaxID=562 RepID=UPI0029307F96|nr:filamentous hemagglutinin N-terminal domain-containing protein [Escherichia coli]